jgi:hypothetical protein
MQQREQILFLSEITQKVKHQQGNLIVEKNKNPEVVVNVITSNQASGKSSSNKVISRQPVLDQRKEMRNLT